MILTPRAMFCSSSGRRTFGEVFFFLVLLVQVLMLLVQVLMLTGLNWG